MDAQLRKHNGELLITDFLLSNFHSTQIVAFFIRSQNIPVFTVQKK